MNLQSTTTKHMAERQIEIPPAHDTQFWAFYLPDFTRIFKDWYGRYVQEILEVFRPAAEAKIAQNDKYLVLAYRGERPRDLVERWVRSGDVERVLALIRDAAVAETKARQLLADPAVPLRTLIAAVTRFAAYGLDSVFPEALFVERFPNVPLYNAYFSTVSAWQMLIDRAVRMLDRIYASEIGRADAVQEYADQTSFLRWGDIESADSDRAFTENLFDQLARMFPHTTAIWEQAEARREIRRRLGSPELAHSHLIRRHRADVPDDSRDRFDILIHFAAAAQEYNENRRIIFTRALRRIRTSAEELQLDWRTTSLSETEVTDERRWDPCGKPASSKDREETTPPPHCRPQAMGFYFMLISDTIIP